MDADTFSSLFWDHRLADKAVELLRSQAAPYVRSSFQALINQPPARIISNLNDRDLRRVWIELTGDGVFDRLMCTHRLALPSVSERAQYASSVVRAAVRHLGRARVRMLLSQWWREAGLLEEEQETLLLALAHESALTEQILHEMGPDAVVVAHKLSRIGKLSPELIEGFGLPGPLRVERTQTPTHLASRMSDLMQPVSIALDVQDAGRSRRMWLMPSTRCRRRCGAI